MYVSVAPTKMNRGLDATRGQLEAESLYRLTHVDALLDQTTRYDSDAHYVAYVLHDARGFPRETQPRVNKGGLDLVLERGERVLVYCLVADVDNAGHVKWSSEEQARAEVDRVAALVPTAAIYATSAGLRIIQPLITPLEPEAAEASLGAWLGELLRRGIVADPKCIDWTRHFRAPHVVRDGKPYLSPAVHRRCQQIPTPYGVSIARRRRAKAGTMASVDFVRALPPDLEDAARRLEKAIAPHVAQQGNRHELALRIAGALCKRGVRPELVPAMVGRIFERHSSDVASRIQDAEDTVRRYVGGLEVKGRLDQHFPGLEVALHELFGGVSPARATSDAEPLEQVTARLEEHMRRPPDGVSLVRAQCGLGKTRGFRVVAEERSKRAQKLHTKSAISVPTTKLAEQVQRDLEAAGVPTIRFFGLLSVPGEHQGKACKYHRAGAALASGGLSVAKLLCRGCDVRDGCAAKDGFVGSEDARVAVGPHELVGELDAHAGKTGLLAIDEPPSIIKIEVVSLEELKRAQHEMDSWFGRSYVTCMAPIVAGVIAWLERGLDPESGPITRGLVMPPDLEADALELTGETEPGAWAIAAMDGKPGDAPPVREGQRTRLRVNVGDAQACGQAARVLALLRRAVIDAEDVSASVEDHHLGKGKEPVRRLVLVACERRMHRALRREGSTVVLAADADVIRPLVSRVVGYDPPMKVYRAPEVRVDRTLLRWPGATRSGWLGPLKPGPVLRAIRAAVDWYHEGPTSRPLALVTYLPIEQEIRERQTDFARLAGRELARCRGGVVLGHYGALRGIDDWADLDALATMGDPYPHLGTLEREADWVRRGRLSVGTPDDWAAQHAAAELEQAHGRLRTIHRRRPARQLHVGMVIPSGWPEPRIIDAHEGRPQGEAVPEIERLVEAVGGPAEAARSLGVERSTVTRWIRDERRPPPRSVAALSHQAALAAMDPRQKSVAVRSIKECLVDLTATDFCRTLPEEE